MVSGDIELIRVPIIIDPTALAETTSTKVTDGRYVVSAFDVVGFNVIQDTDKGITKQLLIVNAVAKA